jgi:hypothetical protein
VGALRVPRLPNAKALKDAIFEGGNPLLDTRQDERAMIRVRRHQVGGRLGLVLLISGFGLQLMSNAMQRNWLGLPLVVSPSPLMSDRSTGASLDVGGTTSVLGFPAMVPAGLTLRWTPGDPAGLVRPMGYEIGLSRPSLTATASTFSNSVGRHADIGEHWAWRESSSVLSLPSCCVSLPL